MSETLLYVVQELKASRHRWTQIETESGVSQKTFEKIAHGYTKNPRIDTVERLAMYFKRQKAAAG
jgi:transcriptional regulator with XRE-family HTH domain